MIESRARSSGFGPATLVCLLAGPALAADVTLEISAGATYSDNITRSSDAEVDQTIAIAGLVFGVSGESRRSEGDLSANLQYREYLDDAFESELVPSASANLVLKPAPGRFHWVTDALIDQLRQDPFASGTPDTRENISRISTGPDLIGRLGARTNVQLQGRYSTTAVESSEVDSDTYRGTLSIIRALSPNRNLSLNGSAERVEYDGGVGLTEFDRRSAYVGFDSQISKGSVSLNIGVNEIDTGVETFQSTLAGFSLDRQISEISSISFGFDQTYSDAGDYFSRFDSAYRSAGQQSNAVPVRDPFETQRFTASYGYSKGRVGFSLSGFFAEDQYQTVSALDSERYGASLGGSIEFGSGWSGAMGASFEDRDFSGGDRTDEYLTVTASLDRRLSRRFSLRIGYALEDRSSTASGQDYAENRYSMDLRFSPLD